MVTYRNRDPEPSVRFRPPHPVLKVFAVLFCCVQLLAVPAFAVDDDEWISPSVGYTGAVFGSSTVNVYGKVTHWNLDEDGNGLYDYSRPDNYSWAFPANWSVPLTVSSSGASWFGYYVWPDASDTIPYNHYVSDQSTYYTEYSYDQISTTGGVVWFYSDFYLDPGFYEIDTTFYGEVALNYHGSNRPVRTVIYECGFENEGNFNKMQPSYSSRMSGTIELKDRSRFYVAISYVSLIEAYEVNSVWNPVPRWWLRAYTPDFKYRSIDPLDLVALEEANTNAGNSITDYDNVEQEWTGSMSQNFAQLNVGGFSFGDGLISGFGLVSDLFMKVWSALGSYAIVYTFPLYLGIVLVLMGRVNRFIGHLDRKGDNDA